MMARPEIMDNVRPVPMVWLPEAMEDALKRVPSGVARDSLPFKIWDLRFLIQEAFIIIKCKTLRE
jgi:hypothetical protein